MRPKTETANKISNKTLLPIAYADRPFRTKGEGGNPLAGNRVCQTLLSDLKARLESRFGYATAERLLNPLVGAEQLLNLLVGAERMRNPLAALPGEGILGMMGE
jgi:hypothetical protein